MFLLFLVSTTGQVTLSSFHPFVQQQNDSALSFGEWEIVPSPVSGASYATAASRMVDAEYDAASMDWNMKLLQIPLITSCIITICVLDKCVIKYSKCCCG